MWVVDFRLMTGPLRVEFPDAVYTVLSPANAYQNIVVDYSDSTEILSTLAPVVKR